MTIEFNTSEDRFTEITIKNMQILETVAMAPA
jgi:hypothetical protein